MTTRRRSKKTDAPAVAEAALLHRAARLELPGFQNFQGNAAALAAVRQMAASRRVPGALLFSGPDGVGKKTLALMLAMAMMCERANGDYCGVCGRCRKAQEMLAAARNDLARRREIKDSARRVEGLVYFDLHLIEPITRYILTDQIRQLRQIAYTRPFEFPERVLIIDQADAIHWQAVDLLLKVLEEPPSSTVIMLVTSNLYALRVTLRSRCRRVALGPVDGTALRRILQQEMRLEGARLELAVRASEGSLVRARSFQPEQFMEMRRPWEQLIGAMAADGPGADWKVISEAAKALADKRDQWEESLRLGYSLLRDLLHAAEGDAPVRVVNVDILDQISTWSAKLGRGGIEQLKRGLDQAHQLQNRNVNQQLGLEAMAAEAAMLQLRGH